MNEALPVMYGIPNCDTVKKARAWLDKHHINYHFHDYKKQGIDEDQLIDWIKRLGWQQLINKRGTTWRKLDDKTKTDMNDQLTIRVMMENTSIIKRPLIEFNDQSILGFDEATYKRIFST